ncbi:primase-like DNA-binding domain-containing protein [Sneathia sanguinegens]|uniref:primase-like DNA-binding domain-containing protein n=1 Tax=Sneathia sanguinegens TaxID=40543 RepID=UPI0032B880D7
MNETITSLELVKQINLFREMEGNRAVLQHKDLLKVIRDEFSEEINGGKISPVTYKDRKNEDRPMFILTYNQAKQVLVRESKAVRRAVIVYIEQLENRLTTNPIHLLEQRVEKLEQLMYVPENKQLLIVGDHISEFIKFYDVINVVGVSTYNVYNDYLIYCNNRNVVAVSKTKFTQTLKKYYNIHSTTTRYKGKSIRIYK